MRPRLLALATLAGAIVLFAWQSVSHGVLKLPEKGLLVFPNDSAAVAAHAIRALAPQNGMNFPGYGTFAPDDLTPDYADKPPRVAFLLLHALPVHLGLVFFLSFVRHPVRGQRLLTT